MMDEAFDPRDLIKPRRKKLGISQFRLYELSKVSRADLSLIERKKLPIGPKRARMIEAALKMRRGSLHKEKQKASA